MAAPDHPDSIVNRPDQHGFAMLGTRWLFLDHLPMFGMENHRYHAIFAAKIPQGAMERFVADRSAHPGIPYILGNLQSDLFSLPEIAVGARQSFRSDIFRGVPADPNHDKPLIHDVPAIILRIVRLRHFIATVSPPKPLTYVLFGRDDEAHLSHYISWKPDFQHVQDVRRPDWLPPIQLAMGCDICFPDLANSGYDKSPFTLPEYKAQYEGLPETYPIMPGGASWFNPVTE